MTGTSQSLLRAVFGLRRATEAELSGNSYYRVANRIDDLIESIGWSNGAVSAPGAATGFAALFADVRKEVAANLSGNRYYIVAQKLDELASIVTPARQDAQPVKTQPAGQVAVAAGVPVGPVYSFNELAAASKARVDEVASAFGLFVAHRSAPAHHETEETLADGDLERRSSEPCAMAELAPPIMEALEPSAISPEAAAAPNAAEAAFYLGSPAAQSGDVSGRKDYSSVASPEAPENSPLQTSAATHDTAASTAGQTVETPTFADAAEARAAGRLERRSSGPLVVEPMETAIPSPETSSAPGPTEVAFYLGSPAPESEDRLAEENGPEEIAVELEAERALASEAAQRTPPPADSQRAGIVAEAKPKQEKSLFKLWLDLFFGGKN